MRVSWRPWLLSFVVFPALLGSASGQQERHGRGYKPPPPTATVVITVEKGFNEKPLPNASVIFRAVRDEANTGNLEMKTDPDGRASIDLLEVGSHITVQVIANGFATYATDFDLTGEGKQLMVKLQRPRSQVSMYGSDQDRPAEVQPGVQEHKRPTAPTAATPTPASPTAPLQTTPPVDPPAPAPTTSTPPAAAGTPQ